MKFAYATNKPGQLLIVALLFVGFGSILVLSVLQLAAFDTNLTSKFRQTKIAEYLSEAGIEKAVIEIAKDANYSGGTYNLGAGTYIVVVSSSGNDKIVTSSGLLPQGANQSTAKTKAKRRVKLARIVGGTNPQQIAVENAAFTDTGGIEMFNSSTIEGDAKTNGNIKCNGSPTITGNATAAGTIDNGCTVNGTKTANAGSQTFPTFDYQFWRDKANVNNDPISGFTLGSGDVRTYGPKKITGDVTLNNDSKIKLTGPVHITGKLSMHSDSRIELDQSLIDAGNGTVLVVDDDVKMNNSSNITPAAGPSFIILGASDTGVAVEFNGDSNSPQNGPVIFATNGTVKVNNSTKSVTVIANKIELRGDSLVKFETAVGNPSSGSYATTTATVKYDFSKGSYQELK